MSDTWKGSALLARFYQKYGLDDSVSQARVLEWMNEIQEDICSDYEWPFLKQKIKKKILANEQHVNVSPNLPTAPTPTLASGGTLTADSECKVKTTFVLYDETGQEENSIESEPSDASDAVTPTGSNLSIDLANLPIYPTSLVDLEDQEFTEDFADDTGFTYDSDESEFSDGALQQKASIGGDALLVATFTDDTDANFRTDGGDTDGTLVGTPEISGNKLLCDGAEAVTFQVPVYVAATIKWKYTPNYTTAPGSANTSLVSLKNALNNNNYVGFTHNTDGTIRITVRDSSGTGIILGSSIGAWNPTAGTEYEIEFSYDSATGYAYFFVNGALIGSISASTWTMGVGSTVTLNVGGSGAGSTADAYFADLVYYSDIQHTTAYTSGYTLQETLYVETLATLPAFSYAGEGAIQSLESIAATLSGNVGFILNGKYWNGSAWVNSSDTYATSCALADALANIASLDVAGLTSLVVDVVFSAGTTQGLISAFSLEYTGQQLSGIDYEIHPTLIHRRVYLKQGSNPYYLAKTIEDNISTTTTITTDPDNTIEPPEYSMVEELSDEDIYIESNDSWLVQKSLAELVAMDPSLSSTGTPYFYARISKQKIIVYPKPDTTYHLSYFIKKKPSRIFNDSLRPLQIPSELKKILDAGVTWKGYEYRDRDGQESKLSNYEQLKDSAWTKKGIMSGEFGAVKEVY